MWLKKQNKRKYPPLPPRKEILAFLISVFCFPLLRLSFPQGGTFFGNMFENPKLMLQNQIPLRTENTEKITEKFTKGIQYKNKIVEENSLEALASNAQINTNKLKQAK